MWIDCVDRATLFKLRTSETLDIDPGYFARPRHVARAPVEAHARAADSRHGAADESVKARRLRNRPENRRS